MMSIDHHTTKIPSRYPKEIIIQKRYSERDANVPVERELTIILVTPIIKLVIHQKQLQKQSNLRSLISMIASRPSVSTARWLLRQLSSGPRDVKANTSILQASVRTASRIIPLQQRILSTTAESPTFPSASNDPSSYANYNKDRLPVQADPTYYVPKAERNHRSVFALEYMTGETRLARNSRTCPTRELYFLNAAWGRHKSPYRKFRHMANLFRAAPFQRLLFPDLASIATVAGCLTYYNEYIVTADSHLLPGMISMSPTAFAGATTAIGLLAGFRLNASYGRVKEGRKAWSSVNTATRDLARHVLMWVPPASSYSSSFDDNNKQTTVVVHAQKRMLRLCQAFPVTLMFYLNDKGCYYNMKRKSKPGEAPFADRVQAEFQAELYDVYYPQPQSSDSSSSTDRDILLRDDYERLCHVKAKGGMTPLEVLTCMTETIGALSRANKRIAGEKLVNPIYLREIDTQVQRLGLALGSCEQILKTPLPTGFTRHSSRLLFIWSNCLPMALYPLLGPMGTLPTALMTAYAILGIEDISVQLEEPFDILPLREYSDSMYSGLGAIEKGYSEQ